MFIVPADSILQEAACHSSNAPRCLPSLRYFMNESCIKLVRQHYWTRSVREKAFLLDSCTINLKRELTQKEKKSSPAFCCSKLCQLMFCRWNLASARFFKNFCMASTTIGKRSNTGTILSAKCNSAKSSQENWIPGEISAEPFSSFIRFIFVL